jgi:hypothetical protein
VYTREVLMLQAMNNKPHPINVKLFSNAVTDDSLDADISFGMAREFDSITLSTEANS